MTSTKWGYEKNFNRRFFLIGKKTLGQLPSTVVKVTLKSTFQAKIIV